MQKGIKVLCSGRLGGAEIARNEKSTAKVMFLSTLSGLTSIMDFAEADTTYGKIGIKVWINHGEILDKGLQSPVREEKRDKRDGRKGRKDGDRRRNDRRNGNDNRRNDRRNNRNDRNAAPEAAPAVNPRVRKAPKAAPKSKRTTGRSSSRPAETAETEA